MDRVLRFAAATAFGFSFAVPTAMADSHGGVTVGGWIEAIGGSADNDEAGSVDGISRGFYSRITVSYDDTLDNGLKIAGRIGYHLNQRGNGVNITADSAASGQRMDAVAAYPGDVQYFSIGGGFGTATVGAAPPASCATLPRPIAFAKGVNSTHYRLFSGLEPINETFSEFGYCTTSEQLSYTTPTVGGFRAMASYIPDHQSTQGTDLKNAQDDTLVPPAGPGGATTTVGQGDVNIEDRIDLAANWSGAMGGMNVSLGIGHQQGQYQNGDGDLSSTAIAGTLGFGAFTVGAQWYDTEQGDDDKHDGYALAAKYDVGNLTLAAVWSAAERKDGTKEDSSFVLFASYAMGGGLTTWVEYMAFETDCTPDCGFDPTDPAKDLPSESDDIILVGVTLGF